MAEAYRPRVRYVVEATFKKNPLPQDASWKFICRCRTLWGARIWARRIEDGYRHVRVIDTAQEVRRG